MKEGIIMNKKYSYRSLILTSANLITRILGFVYRIYMSNIIGAEGMGLYQLIFPIFILAWTISGSGISLVFLNSFLKKMQKEYGNSGRILKISVIISAGIGFIISLFIFFLHPFWQHRLLKKSEPIFH